MTAATVEPGDAGEPTAADAARFPDARLQRYLGRGMRRVEGWLDHGSARLIAALSRFQTESGIAGPVGEFGIHHGKLFILLYLTTRTHEPAFAIDVFADQHLNAERSGRGDEGRFLRNVDRFAGSREGLRLVRKSTLDLKRAELLALGGAWRLVSIDAGHAADSTLHDLRLADAILGEGGVAVLDDAFNQDWPGVISGLAAFLSGAPHRLTPFLISQNKLYLCRPERRQAYTAFVRARPARRLRKTAILFGHDVEVDGTLEMPLRATALPDELDLAVGSSLRLLRRATHSVWRRTFGG